MLLRPKCPGRHGTTAIEAAVIYPITFLLMMGLIIGGLGIFRYQELASLAREATRYASVHGSKYAQVTGYPAATPTNIYNKAIQPNLVILDPNQLQYSVTWNTDNRPGNTVTVQITYQWIPEAFLGGITLSSTATATVSY
jgi:Flp pilus assembly protein TadG